MIINDMKIFTIQIFCLLFPLTFCTSKLEGKSELEDELAYKRMQQHFGQLLGTFLNIVKDSPRFKCAKDLDDFIETQISFLKELPQYNPRGMKLVQEAVLKRKRAMGVDEGLVLEELVLTIEDNPKASPNPLPQHTEVNTSEVNIFKRLTRGPKHDQRRWSKLLEQVSSGTMTAQDAHSAYIDGCKSLPDGDPMSEDSRKKKDYLEKKGKKLYDRICGCKYLSDLQTEMKESEKLLDGLQAHTLHLYKIIMEEYHIAVKELKKCTSQENPDVISFQKMTSWAQELGEDALSILPHYEGLVRRGEYLPEMAAILFQENYHKSMASQARSSKDTVEVTHVEETQGTVPDIVQPEFPKAPKVFLAAEVEERMQYPYEELQVLIPANLLLDPDEEGPLQ